MWVIVERRQMNHDFIKGDINKQIGLKIRERRKEKGFSQEELGEKLGLSGGAIGQIERGITSIKFETLISICDVLQITPAELVGKELFGTYRQRTAEKILKECSVSERILIAPVLEAVIEAFHSIERRK